MSDAHAPLETLPRSLNILLGAALLALAAETERAEWASGLKDAQVRDVAGPGFIPAPVQLNPHQQLLAEAAQARGLSARAVPSSQVTRNPLPRMVLMIDAPGGPVVYHSQFLSWLGPDGRVNRPVNGPRTFDLLDKVKTKRHLLANGIPVPAGQAFRREDLAGAFRARARLAVGPRVALLGDRARLDDGREIGTAVFDYPSGDHGILLDPKDPHLARQNPADYVAGLATRSGDPSPVTAHGVFRAIQASARPRPYSSSGPSFQCAEPKRAAPSKVRCGSSGSPRIRGR